jgi:hypothetical protein
MIAFKVTDNCWHGYKPFEGQRQSLQINYLTDAKYSRQHIVRHRVSAFFKKLLKPFASPINNMRVLIIKLSSMGDLMHALPALTDAVNNVPGISFDWVVDENFAEVPKWHPAVENLIVSAHRRWKKNLRAAWT